MSRIKPCRGPPVWTPSDARLQDSRHFPHTRLRGTPQGFAAARATARPPPATGTPACARPPRTACATRQRERIRRGTRACVGQGTSPLHADYYPTARNDQIHTHTHTPVSSLNPPKIYYNCFCFCYYYCDPLAGRHSEGVRVWRAGRGRHAGS